MRYKTLQYADSTGRVFLDENGTGRVEIYSTYEGILMGNFVNGLKDGVWKEYVPKQKITYDEIYENGKFIKGTNTSDNGEVTEYDKFETLPSFKGGMETFGKFLTKNLRYPPNARKDNIQGRVYIQFIIKKDGTLSESKILKGIGGGCDEEALRVINLSPDWNPGLQRGIAKNVSYSVPIFFKLSESPKKIFPYQQNPYNAF
ncbi:energy transducer TonB [Pedobacter alpinus]|uniref:TonB family protein n=1 Tax=Pedobacter alpinus TaxID=1590643 RepID=A0ABW5TS79_9SPHI